MKRIYFLLVAVLVFYGPEIKAVNAPLDASEDNDTNTESVEAPTYKLYKTQNMWIFIKLNTQDGRMKLVQFSVNDVNDIGEFDLNIINLALGKEKKNGRFTLTPTDNMYNFLLLDQIDGDVWQVQWDFEPKNRFVRKIE